MKRLTNAIKRLNKKRWSNYHYSFIFLLLIPLTQDDDSDKTYLSESQVRQVIVGNTLQRTDKEIYALMRADGTITAKLPNNVLDQGKWRVFYTGAVCVQWQTRADKKEHCGKVASLGDNNYQWNDLKFKSFKGNIKNL